MIVVLHPAPTAPSVPPPATTDILADLTTTDLDGRLPVC